jgi:hypothetical protein
MVCRFEAYLGTAIQVSGKKFGVLEFASLRPHGERFTASHKDLLILMAQWIGTEIERELHGAKEAPAVAAPAPRQTRSRKRSDSNGLHLNAVLEKLERRIRRVVGTRISVIVKLGSDIETSPNLRIPIDAIILSLVRKAAESMNPGGKLTLTTSNLDLAGGDPAQMHAVVPDRYVTLAVHSTGGAVDSDSLALVFDREVEDDAHSAAGASEGGLPLAAAYRILQRAGGDLSVEVEPGMGTTFVLFLPLGAETEAATPETPRPSTATTASHAATPEPARTGIDANEPAPAPAPVNH